MASIFYISYKKLSLNLDLSELHVVKLNEENLNKINYYIYNNPNFLNMIKKGDIIKTVKNELYANDGKFVWNGHNVVILDYSLDKNGSIPKEFIVSENEFSPEYWRGIINYSNYYYPSKKIRKEVFNNFFEKESYFIFNGEKYKVFTNLNKEKILDMNIPFELISHINDENDEYGENISIIN